MGLWLAKVGKTRYHGRVADEARDGLLGKLGTRCHLPVEDGASVSVQVCLSVCVLVPWAGQHCDVAREKGDGQPHSFMKY